MTYDQNDPLGGEKTPSVSWKDVPQNEWQTFTVLQAGQKVQARNYDTGKLETWDDGNPKYNAVYSVADQHGEERGLFVGLPSKLATALRDAQKEAGETIAAGGTLAIRWTGMQANPDKPRLNPARVFEARYKPGNTPAPGDPLAAKSSDPWAAPPATSARDIGRRDFSDPPF